MTNSPVYHISYRMLTSFVVLAIVMALCSWFMFFGVKTEHPAIDIIPLNVFPFVPALCAFWCLGCCIVSWFSGIMIRPMFSTGRSGLWLFILISWSYWIIGGFIVCIVIAVIVVSILLSNGCYWIEGVVSPIESVVILGIPYSLFTLSLISFSIIKFCPQALAWLVGNFFFAVACIGTVSTFVYIISSL